MKPICRGDSIRAIFLITNQQYFICKIWRRSIGQDKFGWGYKYCSGQCCRPYNVCILTSM